MGAKGGKEIVDGQSKGSNGQESSRNEGGRKGPTGVEKK
jgi:hypothetical protein